MHAPPPIINVWIHTAVGAVDVAFKFPFGKKMYRSEVGRAFHFANQAVAYNPGR
jgi:hypothetical protein